MQPRQPDDMSRHACHGPRGVVRDMPPNRSDIGLFVHQSEQSRFGRNVGSTSVRIHR